MKPGWPRIINLFAAWCTPRVTEMPQLAEFAAGRDDIPFLFVNSHETGAKVQAFLARMKLGPMPIALDPDRRMAGHYRSVGLPITLFLKRDGSLSSMVTGEMTRDLLERSSQHIVKTAG